MEDARPTNAASILLVDDEPDQIEMYRYALEDAGFAVLSALTGGEALRRGREDRPDLIVLDIRLPDMTGWDVCSTLKRDPRTAPIPIVILTAAASATLATDAANAGCAAFLLKPCYPEDLIISIRTVLAGA